MEKALISLICIILCSRLLSQHVVEGKVTDENNDPTPGVTVTLDSGYGTTTDVNGYYRISSVMDTSTLTFSFVGYKKFSVKISGQTTINVQLEPDRIELFESCWVPTLYVKPGLLINTNGWYGASVDFTKIYANCIDHKYSIVGDVRYKSDFQANYSLSSSIGLSDLKYCKYRRLNVSALFDKIHSNTIKITDYKGRIYLEPFLKRVPISGLAGFQQYNAKKHIGLGLDLSYGIKLKPVSLQLGSSFISWMAHEEYTAKLDISKWTKVPNNGLKIIRLGIEYRKIKDFEEISIMLRLDFLVKSITYI